MDEMLKVGKTQIYIGNISWLAVIIFIFLAGYYLVNIGNRYVERSKRIKIDFVLIKRIFRDLLILFISIFILRKNPILGKVLTSAIISAILAYILNPLVNKLEDRIGRRGLSVGIVYLSIFLLIIILFIVVVPQITLELRNLVLDLPKYADYLAKRFSSIAQMTPVFEDSEAYKAVIDSLNKSYNRIIQNLMDWISDSASSITTIVSHSVQNIISVLFSLALIMIMTYYFLVDKIRYKEKVKQLIPSRFNDDIRYLSDRINKILSEFIRGRIILAVFVGAFTAILLLILRIDFAIVIGIITCIADIIPYIGPLLGFIPAFLFALIQSPFKALIVAMFYVIIQWAENNILAPKIIGNSMGLNPLFIFLSIVIGGGIFGVWGMVVSVPLAATGLVLIEFFRNKLKAKKEEKDVNNRK
ncbi:MAG: AI-2E family transporter [Bacillota bacterium]|nr:AI-2E family transporter [Bacillota bacterium]